MLYIAGERLRAQLLNFCPKLRWVKDSRYRGYSHDAHGHLFFDADNQGDALVLLSTIGRFVTDRVLPCLQFAKDRPNNSRIDWHRLKGYSLLPSHLGSKVQRRIEIV